ncbi:MAG: hypothetical protein P8J86_08215 [Phycisphaerales bacterium]|nr:hypothetical protein [Phycisphaerales bacterium]
MRLSVLAVSMTGLFVIIMAAVLLMIRGRRVSDVPACPSCRYCVRDLQGCICPECGHDLCSTGVLTGSRIPVARWIRGLSVVLLAVVLFATYARVTFTPFQDLADALFGRQVDHSGDYAVEIGFQPQSSEVRSVRVAMHGPDVNLSELKELWNDQLPMHVRIQWHDDRQQLLLLVPIGHDQDGVTDWRLEPEPALYRFQPSMKDLYPKEVESNHLDEQVAQWMAEAGPLTDPWDPARFVLSRIVSKIQLVHQRETSTIYMSDVLGESSLALAFSRIGGTMMVQSASRVPALWLIFSSWIVIWLIVLIAVLIPGVRYEAWPAETQSVS